RGTILTVMIRPTPGALVWPAAMIVWGPAFTSARHNHHCVQLLMAMDGSLLVRNDKMLRERLGKYASKITNTRRTLSFDYPFPPRQVVQFFRDYFGPTQVAFSRLDPAGQTDFAADLEKLWSEHNRGGDGHTLISAEYLEVIATCA